MLQTIVPHTLIFQAPPAAALIQSAQSDPAVGRLPTNSVAATINVPQTTDNSRGSATMRMGGNLVLSTTTTSTPAPSIATSSSLQQGSSPTFLAQLFGQSSDSELSSLNGFFSESAPKLGDYSTLVNFSQTKYMPSHAALPSPMPQANRYLPPTISIPQPADKAPAPQVAIPDNKLIIPPVVLSQSVPQQPAVQTAAVVTIPLPKAEIRQPALKEPGEKNGDEKSAPDTSLIAPRGLKAYVVSAIRAAQQLTPKPAPTVAFAM